MLDYNHGPRPAPKPLAVRTTTMKKILIVEDSATVTKILKHLIKQQPTIEAFFAGTLAEGQAVYQQHKDEIFASVIDLNLPDAPNGETVDYFLNEGLPVIVLTGNYKDETREALLEKGIVDYVIKESRYSYNYVFKLIDRLERNQKIKVLVTEDSKATRNFIKALLEKHLYQVLEASNGIEALGVLKNNPDIKLLITDYHMPEMDGFELVKTIRQNVDKTDLVIIGLSGEGKGALSAKFIKNGANDFLPKPFYHEEFYCRIIHNIESLEHIEKIRDNANRDYLTGLYNRRFFYENAEQQYQHAKQADNPLAAAVINIDHFKKINDAYGHSVGDAILIFFSQELAHTFERFSIARLGGEEFSVLLPGLNNEQAVTLLDRFRTIISSLSIPIDHEDLDINITVSIGVSNYLHDSLDQQMDCADQLLYHAKNAGRNIVIGDDDEEEQ